MNHISDADFLAEQKALRIAIDAQKQCFEDFQRAVLESASTETRETLLDCCNALTDILGDLNGQKALVEEAYRTPAPPRDFEDEQFAEGGQFGMGA